jgi:hypothetical protein
MIIGEFQGESFSFRVEEAYDGYLVRPLDILTGAAEDSEALLFRSASTAFAYAEMIAAAERLGGDDSDDELERDARRARAMFRSVSLRLVDDGAPLALVAAHAGQAEATRRPRLH